MWGRGVNTFRKSCVYLCEQETWKEHHHFGCSSLYFPLMPLNLPVIPCRKWCSSKKGSRFSFSCSLNTIQCWFILLADTHMTLLSSSGRITQTECTDCSCRSMSMNQRQLWLERKTWLGFQFQRQSLMTPLISSWSDRNERQESVGTEKECQLKDQRQKQGHEDEREEMRLFEMRIIDVLSFCSIWRMCQWLKLKKLVSTHEWLDKFQCNQNSNAQHF